MKPVITLLQTKNKGGERTHCQHITHSLNDRFAFNTLESRLTPIGLLTLLNTIRNSRATVIHSHGFKALLTSKLLSAIWPKCPPIIATFHGAHAPRHHNKLKRWALTALAKWNKNAVSDYITISKSDAKVLKKAGIITTSHYIPNGIPIPPPQSEPISSELDAILNKENTVKIAIVGALEPIKNPEIIVDLAIKVEREPLKKNLAFIVIGTGPLLKKLKKRVTTHKLNNIHFIGQQSNVPSILSKCDALLHNAQYEGLPYVILEAMSVKCPIIASDVPGNTDIITHEKTGWLYPFNNTTTLYDTLNKVVKNTPNTTVVENAYDTLLSTFQLNTQMEKLALLYQRHS